MKKPTLLVSCFSLLALSLGSYSPLFAAPAGKAPAYEPVAEGYCAWAGLTDENFICGRRYLCPSDLRHKLVSVIFIDASKWEDQCTKIVKGVSGWNPLANHLGSSAETYVIPREKICLVVFVGKEFPTSAEFGKFLKKNYEDFGQIAWFCYANVSGSKVPDAGGKYPFYCVFGPQPGDPLASGAYDDAAEKKLAQFKKDLAKKHTLENWKPYFGTVEEPKAVKGFAKTVASGKPLEGLVAACKKGISNKDAEKSKECQILYDALEQTRSDYLYDVLSFARSCPTRAFYEGQILVKQFPRSKKLLQPALDHVKSIPDMSNLCKMFNVIKKVSAEDFTCKNAAEAKKYEAELLKMKTTCDALIKKSSNNVVQSAAAWIGAEAENLAPQMAGKVPVK